MPEVDPLTIEERFTRDLARRQAIIATQFGGDADAYLEHFFAELNAEYNPAVVVEPRENGFFDCGGESLLAGSPQVLDGVFQPVLRLKYRPWLTPISIEEI